MLCPDLLQPKNENDIGPWQQSDIKDLQNCSTSDMMRPPHKISHRAAQWPGTRKPDCLFKEDPPAARPGV